MIELRRPLTSSVIRKNVPCYFLSDQMCFVSLDLKMGFE